eukprot:TRINITY_DN3119_c0_g1_i7.p1 TRINITY_DN3119_c0_g1~~TRINITY_DN3119_c0_g1_i7.p1  ORF type:complete len:401 (+),score=42.42 TRINITY_DN3119_c0_g1_i7:100-1302(+)
MLCLWAPWLPFLPFFTFLSATQDIAVDGWGLEMFPVEDRHTAAACQTVGLRIGFFLSYTVFLFLNSPHFCNTFLRTIPSDTPILSLGVYIFIAGVTYIFLSVLLIFKREKPLTHTNIMDFDDTDDLTPLNVYKRIFALLKLPNLRKLIFVLLTNRVGVITAHLFTLHLASRMPQHVFAEISVVSFILEMLVMWFMNKKIQGSPLSLYLSGYSLMLVWALMSILAAWVITPEYAGEEIVGGGVFVLSGFLLGFRVLAMIMFLCLGSFFTSISDSSIGGTYLTLVNTVTNLGGTWPQTIIPAAVDWLSLSYCRNQNTGINLGENCARSTRDCSSQDGVCVITFDGFYIVCLVSIVIGVFSTVFMKKTLIPLQNTHSSHWTDTIQDDVEEGRVRDKEDRLKFC